MALVSRPPTPLPSSYISRVSMTHLIRLSAASPDFFPFSKVHAQVLLLAEEDGGSRFHQVRLTDYLGMSTNFGTN